jgi:hypothetical protein
MQSFDLFGEPFRINYYTPDSICDMLFTSRIPTINARHEISPYSFP